MLALHQLPGMEKSTTAVRLGWRQSRLMHRRTTFDKGGIHSFPSNTALLDGR